MKFGKDFKNHLEETLPEWRDKFLCYKPLKKLLKNFPSTADDDEIEMRRRSGCGNDNNFMEPQEWFVRILIEELEKFNDFYVDKEEDFVIRFQELKVRIERLKGQSSKNGIFTSESEFSEEMMEIRKDLVTIHGEMVLLKNYSSLNFAGIETAKAFSLFSAWRILAEDFCSVISHGLIKILKKYDKRTGGLLRLPFTQHALHQPFFTTEPLTRLVRECEANLELLFPLEAEVIEFTNTAQAQPNPPFNNAEKISQEASLTLGKEAVDIYRSTVAAMKAILGLQKASSTCNPLSFSIHFNGQGDESTGEVTEANSASNSPATTQMTVEPGQEDSAAHLV